MMVRALVIAALLFPLAAQAAERPDFLKGTWAQPDCGHAQTVTIFGDEDMTVVTSAGLRIVPVEWVHVDGTQRSARGMIDGQSYDFRTSVDAILMQAETPPEGAPDPFTDEASPAISKSTHCVEVFTDNPMLQRRLDAIIPAK